MTFRVVRQSFQSVPTREGAGVRLKRAFGYHQSPAFDPFLMLDDFHSSHPEDYLPGFPWHPHRGIETITYLLEGRVEHGDSLGNRGTITAGEVQWMTAGSGIIHQEMPQLSPTGTMWGFQLWGNLPASHKMMPPRYRDVKGGDIPEVTLPSGASIKIISGEVNGRRGPVRDIVIDPELLDITLPPHTVFLHPVKEGYTLLTYLIAGNGTVAGDERIYGVDTTLLFDHAGDRVALHSGGDGLRLILASGKPLGEPVAWRGPIVMNTREELDLAFAELEAGVFIK